MADEKAMYEKILGKLEEILNTDDLLEEFSVVPTEDNLKNKSPILYEQHNLGLESWCIKHVYNYACSVIFSHKEMLMRRKLTLSKMENCNKHLIGAALLNPEVTTFWNMRRFLVTQDVLNVERELHFSKIALSYKSKSSEVFSYRRWLLKRLLEKVPLHEQRIPAHLLLDEFRVVGMASEKSQNNYHSWNHRIWCMENIAAQNAMISDIVYAELSYTQEWINTHVSEHSGFHYRQYLLNLVRSHKNIGSVFESFYNFIIKQLDLINDGEFSNVLVYLLGKQSKTEPLEESNSYINYISMLMYDLCVLVDKLNKIFPEHEALFYHRRFIVYHLLKLAYNYHGVDFQLRIKASRNSINPSDDKNIIDSDIVVNVNSADSCNSWRKLMRVPLSKVESCHLYRMLLNGEKHFVLENTSSNCSAVQIELAARYQKWMKYVIGFE